MFMHGFHSVQYSIRRQSKSDLKHVLNIVVWTSKIYLAIFQSNRVLISYFIKKKKKKKNVITISSDLQMMKNYDFPYSQSATCRPLGQIWSWRHGLCRQSTGYVRNCLITLTLQALGLYAGTWWTESSFENEWYFFSSCLLGVTPVDF
jgi:hypothetical protein